MTFEEFFKKMSRKNIKKYGNGIHYSDDLEKNAFCRGHHNFMFNHPKFKKKKNFIR